MGSSLLLFQCCNSRMYLGDLTKNIGFKYCSPSIVKDKRSLLLRMCKLRSRTSHIISEMLTAFATAEKKKSELLHFMSYNQLGVLLCVFGQNMCCPSVVGSTGI